MQRRQLDVLIPMTFALLVVVCALWWTEALTFVAVVGAILVGMYWAVFRRGMVEAEGGGRQRDRKRYRKP